MTPCLANLSPFVTYCRLLSCLVAFCHLFKEYLYAAKIDRSCGNFSLFEFGIWFFRYPLSSILHPRLFRPSFLIALSRLPLDKSPMPLRVLIAPDKFKGTLAALPAAQAIERGWHAVRPKDKIQLLPINDGGDGFGWAMMELLGAREEKVKTVGANHGGRTVRWWWEPKSKTAVIESANVIGLALLPPGEYHPFKLDTLGLGRVLRAALDKGARRCFVGIGGSATNDGGFGVARSVGWEFLDHKGRPIWDWTQLHKLDSIRPPEHMDWPEELTVAVDVRNPLLGPRGCTRIYGPQKGLKPRDFPKAERALQRLAQVATREFGRDFAREPGAGSAGGLGFGLACFLGARLQPGFALFAEHAHLDPRLRKTDLVITGEGAIDASTLMGKGVGELAARCHKLKIPCIGLAGRAVAARGLKKYFARVAGLTDITSLEKAKARPWIWLEELASRIGREWNA
jgi:glycerate kinase